MKNKSLFAAGTMLLLPALAFAGQKNSAHVQFQDAVTVAGTKLAAGEYKVTWQGNGPDVTVSFVEGRKVVATAPARLVNQQPSEPGAIETEAGSDKTEILQAVDLKHASLQFGDTVPVAGN